VTIQTPRAFPDYERCYILHRSPATPTPSLRFVPTILLTDPEQRSALAAARALAEAGHRVVTAGREVGIAGRSRATSKAILLPGAVATDAAAYRAALAEIVQRERVDALLPVTDAASRRCLGFDDALGCRVLGPSAAGYARASDKAHLMEVARSVGLRVPRQWTMNASGDAIPSEPSAMALVVKPSRSVVDSEGGTVASSVRFADTHAQLEAAITAFHPASFPLLIQERTYGHGVGVFLLRHAGNIILRFGHRRIREKPPAGGVSTFREAVEPPEQLVAQCERLLATLEYDGPAMVEFKEDERTGEFVLMEINARLWGSLQLAIDAGVNFPVAMVALAFELPLSHPTPKAGVRSYWEFGELDHALALARRSREALHVPPSVEVGVAAAMRALANRRLSDRPEVFRLNDPAPFLYEAMRWGRGK